MTTKQRGSVSSVTRDGTKTWYWAIRLDTSDRDQRQVKRFGYSTRTAAGAALDHVRALLAVAGDDDRVRRLIGDLVVTRSRRGGTLPAVEEVQRRYGAGLDPGSPSMTLGAWFAEWLAANRRARASTRLVYEGRGQRFWLPHLGDVPLDRLRTEHVTAALDWLDVRNDAIAAARAAGIRPPSDPLDPRRSPRPIGPATQRLLLAVLSMALGAAVRRRLLAFNPCAGITLPEAEHRPVRVWSPAQVGAFLASAERDGDPLLPAFRLVVLRGLRRGEACGLRWDDLDLAARTLRVERSLASAGPRAGTKVGPPKTRSSRRTVSLSPGDVAALGAHKLAQNKARLLAGAAYDVGPGGGWVFARADGSPVPPHEMTTRFRRRAEAAGVPVIRFHEGRHTAATLGLEGGVEVKLVSDQLGHSNTGITQDTYQHVRRARHDAAAERVDELVFGPDTGARLERE